LTDKSGFHFVFAPELPLTDETGSGSEQTPKRSCHCSRKMKWFTCIGISTVVLLLVAVGIGTASFFTYPFHASCNVTW